MDCPFFTGINNNLHNSLHKCLVSVSKCKEMFSKCLVVVIKCLVVVSKCLVVISKCLYLFSNVGESRYLEKAVHLKSVSTRKHLTSWDRLYYVWTVQKLFQFKFKNSKTWMNIYFHNRYCVCEPNSLVQFPAGRFDILGQSETIQI